MVGGGGLRGKWEAAVGERSGVAFRFGVPSWLVAEEWERGKGEDFLECAQRVKARYFPGGEPGMSTPMSTPGVMYTPDVHTCECGRPRAGKHRQCWGCIKKGQRLKGAEDA